MLMMSFITRDFLVFFNIVYCLVLIYLLIPSTQELGKLASSYDICLHVDLCLGGFVLPFARKLGYFL